ncbi:MAG: lipid-binding SYLF domain-containing protein [Lysobacterales bacterium]
MLLAFVAAPAFADADREVDLAGEAVEVLHHSMDTPDHRIPDSLLRDAEAIAVIPHVVKAGLIFGGRHGRGLLSVRMRDGLWSNPIFISLTGGSVGFQAGVESTDIILVFRSRRGVDSMVNGKFTLGADASVAAGPVGRSAAMSTDQKLEAEIYSYSRSRGLFAGVALDGSVIRVRERSNARVYGRGITPRRILEGGTRGTPETVVAFRDLLEESTSR